MSQREIGSVLGIDQATVSRDANASEESLFSEETQDNDDANASVLKTSPRATFNQVNDNIGSR
jgi:hypothetical protein